MERAEQVKLIMAEIDQWESGDKSAFIEDLLTIHMTNESVDDVASALSLTKD